MGLLCACLLGCATGRNYDDSRIAKIQKGTTTEAELLDWFGPASTRAMAPDGNKELTWRFAGHANSKSPAVLDVKLDADGKVRAYSASAGH